MSKKKPKKLVLRNRVHREEEEVKDDDEVEEGAEVDEEFDIEETPETTSATPPDPTQLPADPHPLPTGKFAKVELKHLTVIHDNDNKMTFVEFTEATKLDGTEANDKLTEYIAEDLVVRGWEDNHGIYSLTAAGEQRIIDLGHKPKKKHH